MNKPITHVTRSQIHDYALQLRDTTTPDIGKKLYLSNILILKIFCMTRQFEYTKALLTHCLVLATHWNTDHVLWRFWSNHTEAFNEELCEARLSSLARYCKNDFTKHEVKSLHHQFLLSSRVSALLEKNEQPIQDAGATTAKKWRHLISPDGPDVLETVSFFKRAIRLMHGNQLQSYTGKMNSWSNAMTGSRSMKVIDPLRWQQDSTEDFIRVMHTRVTRESTNEYIDAVAWSRPIASRTVPEAAVDDAVVEEVMSRALDTPLLAEASDDDGASENEGDQESDEEVELTEVVKRVPRVAVRGASRARATGLRGTFIGGFIFDVQQVVQWQFEGVHAGR